MASRTTEEVALTREQLLEISRDLNTIVVSLDRIGSGFYKDDRGFEQALAQFVVEWRVLARLARARHIVDEALLGPNPTPEQEEALDHGEYWEPEG